MSIVPRQRHSLLPISLPPGATPCPPNETDMNQVLASLNYPCNKDSCYISGTRFPPRPTVEEVRQRWRDEDSKCFLDRQARREEALLADWEVLKRQTKKLREQCPGIFTPNERVRDVSDLLLDDDSVVPRSILERHAQRGSEARRECPNHPTCHFCANAPATPVTSGRSVGGEVPLRGQTLSSPTHERPMMDNRPGPQVSRRGVRVGMLLYLLHEEVNESDPVEDEDLLLEVATRMGRFEETGTARRQFSGPPGAG